MGIQKTPKTPLAERMRPQVLGDFVGQEKLVGPGKMLGRLMEQKQLPSLLLWGPPGTGKTTLAKILAQSTDAVFVFFSAVLSGVKDVREIVGEAKLRRDEDGSETILFVDEIHRFNKSQQDGFLPHVESGLLTLIGATTENPSFQVIAPLLSRCQVLVLQPLAPEHLKIICKRALNDKKNGFGESFMDITDDALDHLAAMADGDARRALNNLEIAATLALPDDNQKKSPPLITLDTVSEACQRTTLRYDADGEEHYNLISALHKSLRDSDPDGALYWLVRMLASGEEPLYIARRLIRFASEDIGNADPRALNVAINGRDAYHVLGSPEGELALVQTVIYLATAPKSNALYAAYKEVRREIDKSGSLPVPLHIRNAPTKLMKKLNYGKGYQYAHDHKDGLVAQDHLPEEIYGKTFYRPTTRGYEAVVKDRLAKWRRILRQRGSVTADPTPDTTEDPS